MGIINLDGYLIRSINKVLNYYLSGNSILFYPSIFIIHLVDQFFLYPGDSTHSNYLDYNNFGFGISMCKTISFVLTSIVNLFYLYTIIYIVTCIVNIYA